MVSIVEANARLVSNASQPPFKIWGLTPKGMTRMVSTAFCINAIFPLTFATMIFSNCAATEQSISINTAGAICLASLSAGYCLLLLKVASRYRMQQLLIRGEIGLSLTGVPIEQNPPKNWIVDNLHAAIIGNQIINCVIACTAGGFIITEQCGIKVSEGTIAPTSIGYIIIAFHVFYLALAIRCGGSRKFF